MRIAIFGLFALVISSFANAQGFGVVNRFGAQLVTVPVRAGRECPEFNIRQGEIFDVIAGEGYFGIQTSDLTNVPVSIQIPGDGKYRYEGTRPNLVSNYIASRTRNVRVSAVGDEYNILIRRYQRNDPAECLLTRCSRAFGPCN